MKVFLLLVVTAVYITDVLESSPQKKTPWYYFWKKPANKTNQFLKRFYCRGRNFTKFAQRHVDKFVANVKRMWFVYWLGVCPECEKTTTTTEWSNIIVKIKLPRGRRRKNPMKEAAFELPWVPAPTKWKITPRRTAPRTTRCPKNLV